MSQISRAVRDAVRGRLKDASTGFNKNLADVASSYGIQAFEIRFGDPTRNFFQGNLAPESLDAAGIFDVPLILLYTANSANQNIQKFTLFSGVVTAVVEVYLEWRSARALPDFASLQDAVEDAMYKTFNDSSIQGEWSGAVNYNGDMAMVPSPVTMAGENWRQILKFQGTFEVHTT